MEEARALRRKASGNDRRKLDEYLRAARGVEKRIHDSLREPKESKLQPGSRIDIGETPIANPHLTLTNKMGLGIERFNNGAGKIAALQGRVRAALRAASAGLRWSCRA